MTHPRPIDPSWHPLAQGWAPEWASEWGEDRHGVFAAFTLGEVTQRLRWIPAGRFWMGSPPEETRGLAREDHERKWFEREHPRHQVYLSHGFWLFDTPCTQALWEAVMCKNPSRFHGPERPVEQVSWEDVQAFLEKINAEVPGLALALPTEAQWEHACRAGTETALYSGPIKILGENNAPALDLIAWYGGSSGAGFEFAEGSDSSGRPEKQYLGGKAGTHRVKGKEANPWGLYDMLGNVWEWCADGLRDYGGHCRRDPVGPLDAGVDRVIRGGSWSSHARLCRCAFRSTYRPDVRDDFLCFRCARAQER